MTEALLKLGFPGGKGEREGIWAGATVVSGSGIHRTHLSDVLWSLTCCKIKEGILDVKSRPRAFNPVFFSFPGETGTDICTPKH